MPSDQPPFDDRDGPTDDIAERHHLEHDEAAPEPQPDADQGPDGHVGGGQDLDADDGPDVGEDLIEELREIEQVAQASGELPDDMEPLNATGFDATDQEQSHLAKVADGDYSLAAASDSSADADDEN